MKKENKYDYLGPKIRHFRQLKDYSQEYMAFKLGLTQTSYSKLEKNASEASLDRLHKISEILEVKLVDLINMTQSNPTMYDILRDNDQGRGNIIINNYPVELLEKIDAKLEKLLKK
jgi:transcriptional regulator with XRE-family HTH domain